VPEWLYFIEKSKNNLLIWFRKEFDEHIDWAGNPEKKIDVIVKNGEETQWFLPRTSFHIFRKH
jgi:light-regulated signal transduction histidine kinase (bacteriophytochrome)